MAVSAARALLAAQMQSSWNRLRHESGLAGHVAAAVAAGVALIPAVLLPGLFMWRVGASLGGELARGGAAEALGYWNATQAVFTLLFALLGSLRFEPALSLAHFGRFPLTSRDLALAELPAAVLEVFPLLGLAGIVAANAGLASRMPALIPVIALLAFVNVAGMLALLVAAASVRRLLMGRTGTAIAAGACLAAAFAAAARNGWGETLRATWPRFLEAASALPGAFGYAGLVALRGGQPGRAAAGLGIAVGGTVVLLLLSAALHQRALVRGAWARERRAKEPPPRPYRGPAGEVAALFFGQLARSRSVFTALLVPLLMTGTCALLVREIESPPGWIARAPLLAVALYLGVAVTGQIWMNQFGWDRVAIRTLLALPIAPRDILLGKLVGLLGLTLLGWTISATGLLAVYRPSALEVVGGLAAAGTALVVASAVGQFVSLLAPRAVPPGGMAQAPLHLSWIPGALMLALVPLLAGFWAVGAAVGTWFAPVSVLVALVGAVALWRAVLPQAERAFLASREKLLSM